VSRTRGDGRDLLLPLTLPELVLAIAGFLAPLALLVAYSFGEADFLTFDVAITGTIDSFRKLFSPTYRPVLVRSALLSAVTVAACTVIGTPAALAISRLPPRQARAILLAVIAPAFVSFAVRVHAWSNLLSSEGLVEQLSGRTLLFTPAGVALGMIGTYIPLLDASSSVWWRPLQTSAPHHGGGPGRWSCPWPEPASSPGRCWWGCWPSASTSFPPCWAVVGSCFSATCSTTRPVDETSRSVGRLPW
jgi:ABC-type sugar transport system permease subunit